jgi:hypothetical protein
MSGGSKAWTWRHAFSQSDLAPTTKHLLHTLGMFMNELGEGCYPSVADLVRYSGLDKKTVMKHLATAREKGWISVSQHGYRGQRWKRQEYAACWPDRDLTAGCVPDDVDEKGGGAVPPPSDDKVVEQVPEGGGTEVPKVVEQLHQDKTSPITTPLTSPCERERASADEASDGKKVDDDGQPVTASKPETSAEMEKRVMRFCTGDGYQGGEWPKWTGSSLTYIKRRFAELSSDDQMAAERWRDAFLAKAKQQGVKVPMPVGNYFRDHAWKTLSETEMARALAAKDRGAASQSSGGVADVSRPEGWANSMGPVWAALLHEILLEGPENPEHAPKNGLWLRFNLQRAWPKVASLYDMAQAKRGFVASERHHDLKGQMEFVPHDSGQWAAWEAEFKARGWPAWPRRDGMDGMYFPAGGPDGLAAFGEALAARNATHNTGNEAAE